MPNSALFKFRAVCRAFSLLELLVAMAVICMLAAVLVPGAQSVRERAHRFKCASNIRQIGLAVEYYKADNDRHFPIKGAADTQFAQHTVYMNELGSNYLHGNFAVFKCPSNKNTQGDPYRTNSLGQMDYEINRGFYGIHLRGKVNNELKGITDPSLAALLYDWPDPAFLQANPDRPPHPDSGFNIYFVDGHAEWVSSAQSQQARGGSAPYWKWGRP